MKGKIHAIDPEFPRNALCDMHALVRMILVKPDNKHLISCKRCIKMLENWKSRQEGKIFTGDM